MESIQSASFESARPADRSIAFKGFRERLHGHNYKAAVRLYGTRKISHDGYVVDFGDIKKVVRKVCKELNEHFLCPMYSDVIDIVDGGKDGPLKETVTLKCEDGSTFVFPRGDCVLLPIVHATAEELAVYLWSRILEGLDPDFLLKRGVHTLEVTIAEAAAQEASFRLAISAASKGRKTLDVRNFIMNNHFEVKPCLYRESKSQASENIGSTECPLCKHSFLPSKF